MRTGSLLPLLLTVALPTLYDTARGNSPQPPSSNGGVQSGSGPVAHLNESCEPKTINYITHTLPQQCHKSASPTAALTSSSETPTVTVTEQPEPAKTESKDDDDSHDLTSTTFMSFEEWKEMMLKKQGQEPTDVRSRRNHENRADHYGSNSEMDALGDDGEIDLNFDVLADKITEYTGHGSNNEKARDEQQEGAAREDSNTAPIVRSKDAGKTCKERFSYSSFDAGATVLKTSPGAKNAKAILVEMKDTYMLLECAKPNKFFVVELSDDILVDTIVLANFEFFSSMIRHFRVSVSDRYPAKADKWKVLGTFEARNSRDMQAFLVENPAIWAKYLRIEFLTHYGNEYYCPISLLRVHGTRMLETWKEADGTDDDDGPDEIEVPPEETVSEPAGEMEPVVADVCPAIEDSNSPFALFLRPECRDMCPVTSPTSDGFQKPSAVAEGGASQAAVSRNAAPQDKRGPSQVKSHDKQEESPAARPSSSTAPPPLAASEAPPSQASDGRSPPAAQASSSPSSASAQDSVSTPTKAKSASPNGKQDKQSAANGGTPTTAKSKSTTSPGPASPTVQESFFKAVNKRLSQLESNTTLSMQYIESQSRFLQQTLKSLERKQLAKVDAFLDELNTTVISELRSLKQQYDQVWQSTVIALETQKEQSARESVALSQRIQLLADEVVFQKRMAIAQQVLLVIALGLAVFQTRAVSGGAVSSFLENQRANWGMGAGGSGMGMGMGMGMGSMMGSPQQSATVLRSPTTATTRCSHLVDEYGDGGSGTPMPVKRPSYLKTYRSRSGSGIGMGSTGNGIGVSVGMGNGGGVGGIRSASLPMTPTLGSEDEDPLATPPAIKSMMRDGDVDVDVDINIDVSEGMNGIGSSDDSVVVDSTEPMPVPVSRPGTGLELGGDLLEEELELSGDSARSMREMAVSEEGSSIAPPSVFERAGKESSLDSEGRFCVDSDATTLAGAGAGSGASGSSSGGRRVVSASEVMPMPSLPEDPMSGGDITP